MQRTLIKRQLKNGTDMGHCKERWTTWTRVTMSRGWRRLVTKSHWECVRGGHRGQLLRENTVGLGLVST